MTLSWPWALLGLLAVPALAAAYGVLVRRRAGRRAELAALGFLPVATAGAAGKRGPQGSSRMPRIGPALLLAALAVLVLAAARPQATVSELRREATVVLAIDTSTSMTATDLAPTRLEAARQAAKAFAAAAPPSIRIGVVTFGGGGVVLQPPTAARSEVTAALDRLAPQGGTSLGQGIFAALQTITDGKLKLTDEQLAGDLEGVDVGYYGSSVLVMFTDGEDTSRLDPLRLAELAGTAGVRIHTVGLGDPQGTTLTVDGFTVATKLDEQTLQEISGATGGSYFAAPDEASLAAVYDSIELQWTSEPVFTEVTALVAALGLLLLVVGAGIGVARTGRVI